MNKNLKNIFNDDPEMLRLLEQRESNELLKELVKDKVTSEENIKRVRVEHLMGEDGYTPVKGVDYFDGEDGQDYVLTDEDKQEIADSIEVPIVEKVIEKRTEVIKETPIITEIVKEVAVTDKPKIIADKLNTLEGELNLTVIKGHKDLLDKKTFDSFQNNVYTKGQVDQRWHGGGISNITGLIEAGTNVTLTGIGTKSSPYVINSSGGGGSLSIGSSVSGSTHYANLYVDGSGKLANDFILYDPNGLSAINLESRYMVASSGINTLAWEAGVMIGNDGGLSVDWFNRQLEGSGGALSLDWNNRILYENDGTTQIFDWSNSGTAANYYFASGILQGDGSGLTNTSITIGNPVSGGNPYATLFVGATGNLDQGFFLQDSAANGIDYSNGYLIAGTQRSVDWINRLLIKSGGFTTGVLNWEVGQMIDPMTSQLSLDWFNRKAYNGIGDLIIDWDNQFLNSYQAGFPSGLYLSIDWLNRQLWDHTGSFITLDWDAQKLYKVGTSIPVLDWNARLLIDPTGYFGAVDWNLFTLNTGNGVSVDWANTFLGTSIGDVLNWGSGLMRDSSLANSMNWYSRIAYATDGTTPMLDWSGTVSTAAISFLTSTKQVAMIAGIIDAGTNAFSIDTNNRILYAYDGTTPIMDWTTGTTNIGSAVYWFDSANSNRITGDGSGLTNVVAGSMDAGSGHTMIFAPTSSPSNNVWELAPGDGIQSGTSGSQLWLLAGDGSGFLSSGFVTFDISGNLAATSFTGDGSNITSIAPANITGYTSSVNDVLHGDSSWGPVDLAAGVTGVLPVANGGTGQATPVVIAASFSQAVVAATTVTVTLPATQANNTYKLNITPTALLSTAAYYVSAKTTTNFTVTYGTALTGTVAFDWALFT